MLIGEFDELLSAQPFVPFTMVTANGRSAIVKSPEFAWRPPGKHGLRVVWVSNGERVQMINLHGVTKFVLGNPPENASKPRSPEHLRLRHPAPLQTPNLTLSPNDPSPHTSKATHKITSRILS